MSGSSSDHQQQEGDGGYQMSSESPSVNTRQGDRTFPPPVSERVCVLSAVFVACAQQKAVATDDDLSRCSEGSHDVAVNRPEPERSGRDGASLQMQSQTFMKLRLFGTIGHISDCSLKPTHLNVNKAVLTCCC